MRKKFIYFGEERSELLKYLKPRVQSASEIKLDYLLLTEFSFTGSRQANLGMFFTTGNPCFRS